jgi:predicted nucleic acid-binding protein
MSNRVVIDTNIVFSVLKSSESLLRQRLILSPPQFCAPIKLLNELLKHKERIFSESLVKNEKLYDFFESIIGHIYFINESDISTESFFRAYHLCKDVDKNDIPFVALALEFDCPFWTNDEKLKTELRRKGFNNFY